MPAKQDMASFLRHSRVNLAVIFSRMHITEAHMMEEVHAILANEQEDLDDVDKIHGFLEDLAIFAAPLPSGDVHERLPSRAAWTQIPEGAATPLRVFATLGT